MFASPVFPVCGDRRRALCAPPTAPHRSPGPASEQRRPRPPQLHPNRESELLGQAARNMVLQEDAILHSEDSLRKMAIITTHLQYQQEAIQKNVEQSSDLQDQLKHLLK
ncbi:BLOC-1-related complex subunit 7 isoform X1 [Heterocephalus glaber]|uniref:BLOC-1-related complex subunit 7 n=1 Tax=Heterocephalus glaber TaxID=10181 RepID=A0AAX6RX20_HETGA|nr:BLOC-1-related complex subunit 7 isoform X1 [Heterocephalus glaber]